MGGHVKMFMNRVLSEMICLPFEKTPTTMTTECVQWLVSIMHSLLNCVFNDHGFYNALCTNCVFNDSGLYNTLCSELCVQ